MRVSPVVVYLLVGVLVHGLTARWALRSFPALRPRRRAVTGVAAVLAVLPTATRIVSWFTHSTITSTLFAATTLEVVGVGLSVIAATLLGFVVAVVTYVVERARVRGAAAATTATKIASPPIDVETAKNQAIGRREAVERIVGVAAIGAGTTALGWGNVRGRHAFVLEEVVLRVRDWPRALEGYTIVQVSDVHVGAFVGDRELDEGFELVRRARPDLLVATGDLVDFVADAIHPLARHLFDARGRDGALAIVGNHDHYAGAERVAAGLRAAGVRVLCNEGLLVRPDDGGGFALLGVDDFQGRTRADGAFRGPDLGRALAAVRPDRPRILLAHQPLFLDESAGRVDVQLSGHTHGGQINPGFRPVALFTRYVSGRYDVAGTTMWVNRGFGTAGPPARIGAPPEITKLVVVAA